MLAGHAALRPESPWIFFRRGADWRWLSWRAMTQRVEEFAEQPVPEGRVLTDSLTPEVVAAAVAWESQGAAVPPAASCLRRALERVSSCDLGLKTVERDVLVLADPLPAETSACGLAWSLHSGAAVLLEADPALFLPAVLWARPTVFFGRGIQIEALASALPEGSRRPGRRHPLGRLRAIVAVGEESKAESWQEDRWRDFGVSVARLAP